MGAFLKKNINLAEKDHKFLGVVLLALTSQKSGALFYFPTSEIYRALAFVREQDETLSFGRDQELAELMEQVGGLLPPNVPRQRDAPEQSGMTMK